jgi:hypothetical protein
MKQSSTAVEKGMHLYETAKKFTEVTDAIKPEDVIRYAGTEIIE